MRRERGSITAETAVVLPAILMLILAAASLIAVIVAKLECEDAAREAARAAARSEPAGAVERLARQAAPANSTVAVRSTGDQVTVSVATTVRALGGLVTVRVSGEAVSLREPGAEP